MIKVMMSSSTPVMKDGITNVMLNLYKNMDKEKFHIDFITINEPEEAIQKQIYDNGGKYSVVHRSIKHPLRYIKEYAVACKSYDIVHVHGNSATMFLEMFAAKLAGVKVRIAHSHNTYCRFKMVDKIFRIPFYLTCNVRLACGQEAGKWLFGNRNFTVINNGIDSDRFKFNPVKRDVIRNELGWNDKRIIGHIGNFLPAKNHLFLISVFAKLIEIDPTYRLLLLGDGELIEDVKKRVKELNLTEYVVFAGSVSRVDEYLNAMDLIFMPSINEGLPLTLIEEQANGLTCVVSENITRDVNLTGNVNFLAIDQGVEIWADCILKMMRVINLDRISGSEEARKKIKSQNFDVNTSVRRLQDIYTK